MKLFEILSQKNIERVIADFRNNSNFYKENNLRGPSVFENGLCYEFAIALHNYLNSIGEKNDILFLMGSMKKNEAKWYGFEEGEFNPTTDHPFHTIIKIRKFYYDINGRLGAKRDIYSMWSKFRGKRLVHATKKELLPYIKNKEIVFKIEKLLKESEKI